MNITKREWVILTIAAAAVAASYFSGLAAKTTMTTGAALANVAPQTAQKGPNPQPALDNSKIVTPKKFQFAQVTAPADVDSMEAWLAMFPEPDRARLRQFSSKYFGIYNVSGPGQIKWMQTHGYPLPEDVLEASRLTTNELTVKADAGNDKAKMLLVDRLTDEYTERRQAYVSSGHTSSDFNNSDGKELVVGIMYAERQVGSVDSPFAFLLKSRKAELLENADVVTADAARISSILAAQELGETRSVAMLADCVATGQCNAEDVEVATTTSLTIGEVHALKGEHDFCQGSLTSQMPSK